MYVLGEYISLPSYVSAYGWIPFVVAILISILFSCIYVKHFFSESERRKGPAFVAIIGITTALLSAILLPVDIFLVSYMKNFDGSFKEWATNSTRQALEDSVSYTYYSIYGFIFFYTFIVLPLVYFSHEEQDDDFGNSINVFPTALLYTFIFLLLVSGLLVAGAFIPFKEAPPQNSTEWDKIEFLIKELYNSRGKDAVGFVVNVLTMFGMINLIMYTSVGLASLPLTMIKGFRSFSQEARLISENQTSTQAKIHALRSKQATKSLSSREIAMLVELEEEENLLSRRSNFLQISKNSFSHKIAPCMRVVNAILGCIAVIFSLLLFISLLIVNIDKIMNSLGMKMGYVLKENLLPNPLDYIMVKSQTVFPLDYIIYFSVIIFLIICTVSGMRYLGICCLCVPMYKLRPGRTPPQGLIMLTFILTFTILAFHILMYSVLPTYTTFGNQYYCKVNETFPLLNTTCDLQHCSLDAPADDCVMTRGASFVLSFAYKAWIFSAAYYWLTWVFLAAFLIGFIFILIRAKRSLTEEAIDKDDFDDSYDEALVRI